MPPKDFLEQIIYQTKKVTMNRFTLSAKVFTLLSAFFTTTSLYAQGACDCTQRWTQGATWNIDGTVDDTPNGMDGIPNQDDNINGIIRCGSA